MGSDNDKPITLRLYTDGDASVGIGGDEILVTLPAWFRDGIDEADGPGTITPRMQFEKDARVALTPYLDGFVRLEWDDTQEPPDAD